MIWQRWIGLDWDTVMAALDWIGTRLWQRWIGLDWDTVMRCAAPLWLDVVYLKRYWFLLLDCR